MNTFIGKKISHLNHSTAGESVWLIMENLKLNPPEEMQDFKFKPLDISTIEECPKNNKANRRFSLRPRKIKNYQVIENEIPSPSPPKKSLTSSLNKKLETIFEDPKPNKNGTLNILGKAKVKRFISFNDFVSKAKLKHRKSKIKRLVKGKGKKSVKRMLTLEDVKLKLKCLDSSDDELETMEVQD